MSTYYIPDKNITLSEIEIFNHDGASADNIEDDNVLLADVVNYTRFYQDSVAASS